MSFVTTQTRDKNKPKEIKEGFEDGLDPITRIFCYKKNGGNFLEEQTWPTVVPFHDANFLIVSFLKRKAILFSII